MFLKAITLIGALLATSAAMAQNNSLDEYNGVYKADWYQYAKTKHKLSEDAAKEFSQITETYLIIHDGQAHQYAKITRDGKSSEAARELNAQLAGKSLVLTDKLISDRSPNTMLRGEDGLVCLGCPDTSLPVYWSKLK